METDTGWSRTAGESAGRWRTILARASGRATVTPPAEELLNRSYGEPRPTVAPQRSGLGNIEWRTTPASNGNEHLIASIRRNLGGSRVVAFANPKGGVHKTTATVLGAATVGSVRGRGVVAWDDNELRGTLGLRAGSARHARTIRHLVSELMEVESHTGMVLAERLDDFLRHAADGSFDVLAGEEDPRFARRLDPQTVRRVLELLRRTHDVICVDTGNNVESANWQTVMQTADQLVITSVPREDSAFSADWMLDLLEEAGMAELVANAVTLIVAADPSPVADGGGHCAPFRHPHQGRGGRTVRRLAGGRCVNRVRGAAAGDPSGLARGRRRHAGALRPLTRRQDRRPLTGVGARTGGRGYLSHVPCPPGGAATPLATRRRLPCRGGVPVRPGG